MHSNYQWRIQDFPDGEGGANFQGGGKNLLFNKFSLKLHENERIWTERRARVPGAPPP